MLAVTTFQKMQSLNLFSVDFSPTGRGRNKLADHCLKHRMCLVYYRIFPKVQGMEFAQNE